MKKIKVTKYCFGLNPGTELVYNEDSNTYDYTSTNEDITSNFSIKDSKSVSLGVDIVEIYYSDSFEEVLENRWATISNDNEGLYIKPLVIKAWPIEKAGVVEFMDSEYAMKKDDYLVRGIDGSLIPISKKVFDKLFKVIK